MSVFNEVIIIEIKYKKLTTVIFCIAALALFIVGNQFGLYYQYLLTNGSTLPMIIFDTLFGLFKSFKYVSLGNSNLFSFSCGFVLTACIFGVALYKISSRKNYRSGEEYGSAEYGDVFELKKEYTDEDNSNNMICSKNVHISMDTRKTFLNNNICVIGGSGSGKTRFFNKPNILQMKCNYVVTDPKTSLIRETANAFYENGYDVKIMDFINTHNSMHYNPFVYIQKPLDVYKFVNNLVANTKDRTKSAGGDDFFEKAEIALLTACCFFVMAVGDSDERNINTVMDLIDMAEASEEDEKMKSALDIVFEDLEEEINVRLEKAGDNAYQLKNNYDYLAVRQYALYKKAAGKTAKSILISVGVRMAPFNLPEVRELMGDDTVDLYSIGNPKKDKTGNLIKTILYIGISDSDKSLNFIPAIMYQQLFDILYAQADSTSSGRLPIHTRFILDEFANIGQIPDFEVKIATMRSREISVNVILQNMAQLKKTYKDDWETIFGNCDTTLFLGGKEYSTLEYCSKMIGNGTFDYQTISETKGSNPTYTIGNQLINRALLDPSEIGRLKRDECLVLIRGLQVFKDKKYLLHDHENIKFTTDASDDAAAESNYFTDEKINGLLKSAKEISPYCYYDLEENEEDILPVNEGDIYTSGYIAGRSKIIDFSTTN
ncbi:MAG: VirD4-like conjugal transfer protein, CD1115 family [Thomasclavelia sp.]